MRFVSILVAVALALPGCTFNFGGADKEPAPAVQSGAAGPGAEPATGAAGKTATDESALVGRFFAAGWRYCDAVVLSGIWGEDAWEAKVRAGRKLSDGGADGVRAAVDEARSAARAGRGRTCSFVETGYAYADAELLAQAWGSGVTEAKTRVESKVLWGDYGLIDALIAEARSGGAPVERDPDDQAMRAFFNSDAVDYCHAKMLAAAWSSTVSQAKVILGHKVMGGHTDLLDQALGEARSHAQANPAGRCTWSDTGFDASDAARLAELWDTSVAEAKAALTDKYLYGSEANARAMLAGLQPGH